MPAWIIAIQWLSRCILIVLLLLSVWSVATMIKCARGMKEARGPVEKAKSETDQLGQWIDAQQWEQVKKWAASGTTLQAGTVRALLGAGDFSQADRAVRSYLSRERTRLEEGMTVLATLGSNAPFIGLFGTVLGIIQAFGALGAHQNNTADIMIGISEALIATAIGLFVAIPAVVAFNIFSRQLRVLVIQSESLKDLYLSKQKGL